MTELKLNGKPINKIDGYFTQTISGLLLCFKDGKLHRELGPAIFWEREKDKYFNLGDENLYQSKNDELFQHDFMRNINNALLITLFDMNVAGKLYYLNGIHHSEEEFNAILEKKKLNKELEQDLVQNNEKTNIKPKI